MDISVNRYIPSRVTRVVIVLRIVRRFPSAACRRSRPQTRPCRPLLRRPHRVEIIF